MDLVLRNSYSILWQVLRQRYCQTRFSMSLLAVTVRPLNFTRRDNIVCDVKQSYMIANPTFSDRVMFSFQLGPIIFSRDWNTKYAFSLAFSRSRLFTDRFIKSQFRERFALFRSSRFLRIYRVADVLLYT